MDIAMERIYRPLAWEDINHGCWRFQQEFFPLPAGFDESKQHVPMSDYLLFPGNNQRLPVFVHDKAEII